MKRILKLLGNQYLWLVAIILLAFVLRLYKIDNPIADWHSWRQADTAAVSRSFFKEGFNPFIPKYDDMSANSETLRSNPNRYRFVEFPIYNTIVYWGYLLNGGVDERIARLVSVLFACGSIVWIFLLTRKYLDVSTGLLAGFIFAVLPFSVYYGRTILPEATLVFFCLGMVYFTDKWINQNKWWQFILSLIFISCSFLLKPMAVFYLFPLIFSYYLKEQKLWPVPRRYWLLFIPALLPFIGWRMWMQNFPEGIPMSNWLFNGNHIRFRPAFWYWIVGQRLGEVILGAAGVTLLTVGFIIKPVDKKMWFGHFFVVGMIVYLLVFATGNVQHDYYQYLIVPALSIIVARGVVLMIRGQDFLVHRFVTRGLAIFLLLLTIYLPFTQVKGYYQINNGSIVEAGQAADKLLPKDAVVVAPYNGDSAFLYQTNRHGWAILPESIEDLKVKYNLGFYISTTRDSQTVEFMKRYKVLVETPHYIIIDVRDAPKLK